MAVNFDQIVVRVPQPNYQLSLAVPVQPKITIAASPPLRLQSALDVDMTEAADGAVLTWNGGSNNFEAKTSLRNQSVDGGNF